MTVDLQKIREYKYHSPRLAFYEGSFNEIEPDVKAGQWVDSIIIDKEEITSVGDVIKMGRNVFRVNQIMIEHISNISRTFKAQLYYTVLNYTSGYLLPTIFSAPECRVGKKALLFDRNFVNSYINYEDSEPDGTIYLLYRYEATKEMQDLEEWFKNHKDFIRCIHPDKYHTMYKFNLRDQETYKVFMSSRFFKFSEEHKKKIEFFYSLKTTDKKFQILYNSKELREKLEKEIDHVIPLDVGLNEAMRLEDETYISEKMKVVYNLMSEEEL